MSNRKLVQRSRQSDAVTPGQRRQQLRDEEEPLELPPYQKPAFPLSAKGRRALDELQNYDYRTYEKHLKESKKIITQVAGECHDRVHERSKRVDRATVKRKREKRGDDEKTEAERKDELFFTQLQKKAAVFTKEAEQAMRDLIDYGDELAMHENLMTDVARAVDSAPDQAAKAPGRRRRNNGSEEGSEEGSENEDEEEDEDEKVDEPADVLSSLDVLTSARNQYLATYQAKTLLQRYENNDYKGFKQTIHDAQNQGENAPPLPRATQWFNNNEDDEDEDEDIIIAGASTNLKCPITLQTFVVPYSSKACKHTFERDTIVSMIIDGGTIFRDPKSGKREKQLTCPTSGCAAQVKLSDLYEDEVVKSQVKRAVEQAARAAADDDEDFDDNPGRPNQLEDSDSEDEVSTQRARVKLEAARATADDNEDFDDNPGSSGKRNQLEDSDSEDEVPTQRARVKPEASRRAAASEFEEMDED